MPTLKIATFNVNGIRARLPHLLQWLEREQPDIACLQELKAVSEGFPAMDIRAAGYEAIWHGQRSWNGVAILVKQALGTPPVEIRRALPGDPADEHSRYIEAEVGEWIVGCLYLPNGNPQPGPKFDYKLRWMDRLAKHAKALLATGHPVALAGDFNVVPTDFDIYNPRSWRKDALLQPESRERYAKLLAQGWTDALRARHPEARIYTFWDYFREHWPRDAGVDRWVRGEPKASDHAPAWVELSA
jgi:exodeoxyribonuclease-3